MFSPNTVVTEKPHAVRTALAAMECIVGQAWHRRYALLALLSLLASGPSRAEDAQPIRFVALSTEPIPMGMFHNGEMVGGVVKDIGDAIAAKMNTTAVFITLSRKRVDEALERGEVDAICNAMPDWYQVKLEWSEPFLANANLLLMREGVTVSHFSQLRNKTVGGVYGYVYPDLDALVGGPYERDDAISVANTIWKLKAGRLDYAVVDRISLDWEAGKDSTLHALPTLMIRRYQSRCGFSLAGRVPFAKAAHAIDSLIKEGAFERILAHYR